MGFKDEDEVDVFDLSAAQPKAEDYGTETNMFAVDFDVSEKKAATPNRAALPPAPAFADGEDEFDLSSPASASADYDDDDFPEESGGIFSRIKGIFAKHDIDSDDFDDGVDLDDFSDSGDDFPEEKEGFLSKIKGMFAKPDLDDADIDFDAGGDFSDGDFPEEKVGFLSKIKSMFAKPDLDDADIDFDAGGDFSDDDFPEEKVGFFSKIKGIFAKPDLDDDDFDSLPDDDDYTPVSYKDDGGDVFDLDSPAPRTEAAEPEFEEFEADEPEFEAVKAEFEAFGSEPAAEAAKPPEEEEEFDLSASAPPPPPAPMPPPVFSKIAHVCIYVKNLDASLDFYAKLGFKKRFAFNRGGKRFGVYLEFGGGNFIELFEDAGRAPNANGGGLAHFCLETPNIDEAAASLASRGIEHTPKKPGSDSTYQIWLKDPDGNEFEIHQYTPESSQITGRDVEADW